MVRNFFLNKHVKNTSQYKGVYGCREHGSGKVSYYGKFVFQGTTWHSPFFDNEKEAAKAYDKKRIELGLEPVNIFKRAI